MLDLCGNDFITPQTRRIICEEVEVGERQKGQKRMVDPMTLDPCAARCIFLLLKYIVQVVGPGLFRGPRAMVCSGYRYLSRQSRI